VLALILAAVTIPLHALCLTPQWTATRTHPDPGAALNPHAATVLRSRAFIALTAAMTLAGFGAARRWCASPLGRPGGGARAGAQGAGRSGPVAAGQPDRGARCRGDLCV
jgi:hypothetical protein